MFDAYKVKGGLGSVEKYHNITIVYTKEAETADAYIERATYEIGRQHRVRVATSDGPEQIIILGHGALRLSASAFHEEMMEVQKQIGDTVWQNNRKNANSGAVRAAMNADTVYRGSGFGRVRRSTAAFEPPGAEGRIFLGRTHPIDGPVE